MALVHFAGAEKIKSVYSDCSREIAKAVKCLSKAPIPHLTSTPGMPATNGIAENKVKRSIVGTRANLLQAGLPCCWWPFAGPHYAFCRNTRLRDGDSPWNRRHNKGQLDQKKLYPFGSQVFFMPSPIAKNQPHKISPRGVPGIILGFQVLPGGFWHYEYQVAAIDDFAGINLHRNAPATDFSVRIHRVREVYHDETQDFVFPLKA